MRNSLVFNRALAISVFLHAVIAAVVSMNSAERATTSPRTPIAVRLENFIQPAPPPSSAPEPVDAATTLPSEPSSTPAPPAPPERSPVRDWSQQMRDVARSQSGSTRSRYIAPPARDAGLGQAAELRVPELAAAFKPPPPGKICGKEVEFEVGTHKFTMPVAYSCHDKQSEYRDVSGSRPLVAADNPVSRD